MTKVIIGVLIYFATANLSAQTDSKIVYEDVIQISNENVFTDGVDYIIDIPLKTNDKEDIVIENNATLLPNKVFFQYNFLAQFNSVTVISRDWAYYNSLKKSNRNGSLKPVPSSKIYSIKINQNNKIIIDSLAYNIYSEIKRTASYRKTVSKMEDTVLVYYKESWGSICCPRDAKYDRQSEILEFEKKESEKYKTKKSKVYVQTYGYEGEHQRYYTLEDFEMSERLDFIKNKTMFYDESINKNNTVRLFYPFYVSTLKLKEIKM